MIRNKPVAIGLKSSDDKCCFRPAVTAKFDCVSLEHEVSAVHIQPTKYNQADLDICLALGNNYHDRS